MVAERSETAPSSSWHGSISMHDAHAVLAGSCVAYLEKFNRDASGMNAHDLADLRNAFLRYSATVWGYHCRHGLTCVKDDAPMVSSILRICDPQSKSYSAWVPIFGFFTPRDYKSKGTPSRLAIACFFGLYAVVKKALVEDDVNGVTDQYPVSGFTPLIWAILGKEPEGIAQQMLANNANIEARDITGRTALSYAASIGHDGVVQQLLAKGAKIEAKDGEGKTSLEICS